MTVLRTIGGRVRIWQFSVLRNRGQNAAYLCATTKGGIDSSPPRNRGVGGHVRGATGGGGARQRRGGRLPPRGRAREKKRAGGTLSPPPPAPGMRRWWWSKSVGGQGGPRWLSACGGGTTHCSEAPGLLVRVRCRVKEGGERRTRPLQGTYVGRKKTAGG